jgi:hypothetical protein
MLTFLYVAYRHPNPVPMREVETHFGFSQTTNSRNIGYWAMSEAEVVAAARKRAGGDFAAGKAAVKQPEGAEMFHVEVDPHYLKRKLITLTPKGVRFAAAISQVLRPARRDGIGLAAAEVHDARRHAASSTAS